MSIPSEEANEVYVVGKDIDFEYAQIQPPAQKKKRKKKKGRRLEAAGDAGETSILTGADADAGLQQAPQTVSTTQSQPQPQPSQPNLPAQQNLPGQHTQPPALPAQQPALPAQLGQLHPQPHPQLQHQTPASDMKITSQQQQPQPPPPPPPPPPQQQPSELTQVKRFWDQLSEDERMDLVRLDKEILLDKIRKQRHMCSCTVCGRKRAAVEHELEALYDSYYSELQLCGSRLVQGLDEQNQAPWDQLAQRLSEWNDPNYEEDLSSSRFYKVADDLLHNSGRGLVDVMERLAECRIAQYKDRKDQSAHAQIKSLGEAARRAAQRIALPKQELSQLMGWEGGNEGEQEQQDQEQQDQEQQDQDQEQQDQEQDHQYQDHQDHQGHHDDPQEGHNEEHNEAQSSPSLDADPAYYDECDLSPDDQRAQDGRRMLQLFAARMFEQRVFNAYREHVAKQRQLLLLQELDNETKNAEEKGQRKQKDNQKKKDKKRQQKQLKEEERIKREHERHEREVALKLMQERQREQHIEAERRKQEQHRIEIENRMQQMLEAERENPPEPKEPKPATKPSKPEPQKPQPKPTRPPSTPGLPAPAPPAAYARAPAPVPAPVPPAPAPAPVLAPTPAPVYTPCSTRPPHALSPHPSVPSAPSPRPSPGIYQRQPSWAEPIENGDPNTPIRFCSPQTQFFATTPTFNSAFEKCPSPRAQPSFSQSPVPAKRTPTPDMRLWQWGSSMQNRAASPGLASRPLWQQPAPAPAPAPAQNQSSWSASPWQGSLWQTPTITPESIKQAAVGAYTRIAAEGLAVDGFVPSQVLFHATMDMLGGQAFSQNELFRACGIPGTQEDFECLRDSVGLVTHLRYIH